MQKKRFEIDSDNSKVMVLAGKEGLECEIYVDGAQLEQVSEFKYLDQVQMMPSVIGR